MLEGGTDASNTDPYAKAPTADNDWIKTGPHIMLVGSKAMLAGYPSGAKPDTTAPYRDVGGDALCPFDGAGSKTRTRASTSASALPTLGRPAMDAWDSDPRMSLATSRQLPGPEAGQVLRRLDRPAGGRGDREHQRHCAIRDRWMLRQAEQCLSADLDRRASRG